MGKITHFRKFGAAVPQKAIYKNFDLLDSTIAFFNPKVVCFLGDLFHSSLNREWELFEKWIGNSDLKYILVRGNHDIIHYENFYVIGSYKVILIFQVTFILQLNLEEKENNHFAFLVSSKHKIK